MKINSGDLIDAFSHGVTITGRVVGIAGERIAVNTGVENVGVGMSEVLKVNGQVFSDKPVEVYKKEEPESNIIGRQLADGFQRIIDRYDESATEGSSCEPNT